jgi:hypothetical protein
MYSVWFQEYKNDFTSIQNLTLTDYRRIAKTVVDSCTYDLDREFWAATSPCPVWGMIPYSGQFWNLVYKQACEDNPPQWIAPCAGSAFFPAAIQACVGNLCKVRAFDKTVPSHTFTLVEECSLDNLGSLIGNDPEAWTSGFNFLFDWSPPVASFATDKFFQEGWSGVSQSIFFLLLQMLVRAKVVNYIVVSNSSNRIYRDSIIDDWCHASFKCVLHVKSVKHATSNEYFQSLYVYDAQSTPDDTFPTIYEPSLSKIELI